MTNIFSLAFKNVTKLKHSYTGRKDFRCIDRIQFYPETDYDCTNITSKVTAESDIRRCKIHNASEISQEDQVITFTR